MQTTYTSLYIVVSDLVLFKVKTTRQKFKKGSVIFSFSLAESCSYCKFTFYCHKGNKFTFHAMNREPNHVNHPRVNFRLEDEEPKNSQKNYNIQRKTFQLFPRV